MDGALKSDAMITIGMKRNMVFMICQCLEISPQRRRGRGEKCLFAIAMEAKLVPDHLKPNRQSSITSRRRHTHINGQCFNDVLQYRIGLHAFGFAFEVQQAAVPHGWKNYAAEVFDGDAWAA